MPSSLQPHRNTPPPQSLLPTPTPTSTSHSSSSSPTLQTSSRHQINLRTLRRSDPSITRIVDTAAYVVLYTYSKGLDGQEGKWKKEGVEGSLFVFERSSSPHHGYLILNRNGIHNFTRPLTPTTDVDINDEFVHLTSSYNQGGGIGEDGGDTVLGLWFHGGKGEAERLGGVINSLCEASPPITPTNAAPLDAASQPTTTAQHVNPLLSTVYNTSSTSTAPSLTPDGGNMSITQLLAKLSASASGSGIMNSSSSSSAVSAAAALKGRELPPHMEAQRDQPITDALSTGFQTSMSQEEIAAAKIKHLLGLGPAPPLTVAEASPIPKAALETISVGSTTATIDGKTAKPRRKTKRDDVGSEYDSSSSPVQRHTSTRSMPNGQEVGTPIRPSSTSTSRRPNVIDGLPPRNPLLKDSGYIPNSARNGPSTGLRKDELERVIAGGLVDARSRRSTSNGGDDEEDEEEGRKQFVRGILALIHTDQAFVDGVWRRYRDAIRDGGG